MFNIKFDWKTVGLAVLLCLAAFLTWKFIHNSNKVEDQKNTITQLEAKIKSDRELYNTNINTLQSQIKSLNETVALERTYNENLKTLEKVIASNSASNSGLLDEITKLRYRNSSDTASTEDLIRRVDVLSGSLEEVSRGYGEAASDHSRAKVEFSKCKSYLDEVYRIVNPDNKEEK